MKIHQIVNELIRAAQQLGVPVREERGNFRGGRCTVEGQDLIMLNKRHLPEVQLTVLAESLRDLPLDTVFLRPAVRKALEEAWAERGMNQLEEADAE